MNIRLDIITVFSLLVGCLWQLWSISELYFRYPTNISIETHFDDFHNRLPAITICNGIGNISRGKYVGDLMNNFSVKDIMIKASIILEDKMESIITNEVLTTVIEFMNLGNYCFTVNSPLKGNKIDQI